MVRTEIAKGIFRYTEGNSVQYGTAQLPEFLKGFNGRVHHQSKRQAKAYRRLNPKVIEKRTMGEQLFSLRKKLNLN